MISGEIVILLSTISTGILALCGLIIRYSFLSKCTNFKLCCLSWQRDVKSEVQNNPNINLNNPNNPNLNNPSPNLNNQTSISNLNNV